MESELEQRRDKAFRGVSSFLKKYKNIVIYVALAVIIYIGAFIRTRGLANLQNKFPVGLDEFLYLRYAQYIIDHGKLMVMDHLRYFPFGAEMSNETVILPYFIAYLYKILHFFDKVITLAQVDLWYPVICFVIAMIFFYLLIKALTNYKVALVSTALLAVIPTFIFRTMAGLSDKEPLAIMFLFAAMYFYVIAWQSEKIKKAILFAVIAGISTGLMALAWGGAAYLVMTITLFVLIELVLSKISKKDFFVFVAWFIPTWIIYSFFTTKYGGIKHFITSFDTSITLLTLLTLIVYFLVSEYNLFKIKDRLKERLPLGAFVFLLTFIFSIIISTIFFGLTFFTGKIKAIVVNLLSPFGQNRWVLTVAENHQPYISDWVAQTSWLFFIIFLVGIIVLFYDFLKPLIMKRKLVLFGSFTVFTLLLMFTRYSAQSRLMNGESGLSKTLFLGSFIVFGLIIVIYYFYDYFKNKESFEKISELKKEYVFLVVWLVLMITAGRSAIRLLFIVSPIFAIFAAYVIVRLFDYAMSMKEIIYKTAILVFMFLILFLPYVNGNVTDFYKAGYNSVKYTGTSYNVQWQRAMDWAKTSTPEDAVFAHWWDYGYWVQFGSGRATITDGGNWILPWNYYMGRHVLTGQSEKEALEFLKTHNATHLLIISDEIGKYTAFSSIGSDENWDRFSQLGVMQIDPTRTSETRNTTVYLLEGFAPIDEDLIYNEQLFPAWNGGIGGAILPVKSMENVNGSMPNIEFGQPVMGVFYQGKQYDIPLECVFYNGKEYNFKDSGLKGCLRIIPSIDSSGRGTPLGGAIYVSEKVKRTLFTQLYLFDKKSDSFKVAYNDAESGFPLAFYQGRLVGPLKIWEINYPKDIKTNPDYLSRVFLDLNVTKVEGRPF